MRPRLVPAALAVAALAACGGSASTRAAMPADSAAEPVAAAAATPSTATVRIVDFAYRAKTLRVHTGARVTWRNVDTTNHSVTFHGRAASKSIDNLEPGANAVRIFSKAGRFTYVCAFHPFMHGTVVVS
jgi:plastocyanin